MSRTYKDSPNARNNRPRQSSRQRNISVRAVRRDPPDLKKLSRALIALATSEAAAEAKAEPQQVTPETPQKDADD